MRQLTIVFLIVLSSYCGLTTARCLTKQENYDIIDNCAESASPGSTASDEAFIQLSKAVKYYYAKQYGATIEGDTLSDSLKKIGEVAAKCYSSKIDEVSPELAKIWDDCDEITNYQFAMRRKCVNDELRKTCPSLAVDRLKRSPVPDLDALIWVCRSMKRKRKG